jgi:hypothetical protein
MPLLLVCLFLLFAYLPLYSPNTYSVCHQWIQSLSCLALQRIDSVRRTVTRHDASGISFWPSLLAASGIKHRVPNVLVRLSTTGSTTTSISNLYLYYSARKPVSGISGLTRVEKETVRAACAAWQLRNGMCRRR